MDSIPGKNGKKCVYRVVRVSGTMRKAEQEAVRRAREIILKARRELGERSESSLDGIFGAETLADSLNDVTMVDGSDAEDDESDG